MWCLLHSLQLLLQIGDFLAHSPHLIRELEHPVRGRHWDTIAARAPARRAYALNNSVAFKVSSPHQEYATEFA